MVTGFDYLSKDQALQEHWLRRFVAIILDSLIIFLPISIIFHAFGGLSWFFSWWWVGAVLFLYAALFDSAVGGTVGKLLMHLKAVSMSLRSLSSEKNSCHLRSRACGASVVVRTWASAGAFGHSVGTGAVGRWYFGASVQPA